ncbi:MAG: glycoside hydrolase family 88 protein [Chitinophagaceae bacterium]|nr:glycoside hydrolase family 88 protein [Chitinophagaceae bacterium]
MEKNARDLQTGYLYHGYDESREQQWADKTTGRSPHVWGRAIGWYGMALVDVLDYFPAEHPQRAELINILNRFAEMAVKLQDKKSGVWYDIPNLPQQKGNYKEASASCMLVYTLAKASRLGYIDAGYKKAAKTGFKGIQKEFLKLENGQLNLHGTVSVSGLGGKPYRDGSFEYYMSEPVIVNDPKGLGAAILCAAEVEKLDIPQTGIGKRVVLDRYYNSEKEKDITGREYLWHYVWGGWSHPGFGLVQQSFERLGATVDNLDVEPTAANLANASVYIIVDPDHVKDNPRPNYMTPENADVIADWVKEVAYCGCWQTTAQTVN